MRILTLVLLAATPAAAQTPVDQVNWLGGCWMSEAGNRTTIEMWMPPAGGLMVGGSRTVGGGEALAFEHLRIRADGEQLVYTAIPSGQTETDFRSVSVGEDGFTVENLEHDFPQRLVYQRLESNLLTVRVEGPGPDGTRGFDIVFERVRCVSPGA